jgi:hypothetical protein
MTTNETERRPTPEEQIDALIFENRALERHWTKAFITAETILRVLLGLTRGLRLPDEDVAAVLVECETEVIAELKAGDLDPLKFTKGAPFSRRPPDDDNRDRSAAGSRRRPC